MPNYIGVKCPVCSKKFTQADDIIVCPICGAPHHRHCYAEKSHCVFESEHVNGMEWRAPAPDYAPEVLACPNCGVANPAGAIICQNCNCTINAMPRYTTGYDPYRAQVPGGYGHMPVNLLPLQYGGVSPDTTIKDESVKDIAAYVGPNAGYYLLFFKAVEEAKHVISFNIAAFILHFSYFFYRKMYLVGSLMLALCLLETATNILLWAEMYPQYFSFLGVNTLVNQPAVDYYTTFRYMFSTIVFGIRAVFSVCANRMYYNKVLADVKEIRTTQPTPRNELAYLAELSSKGGTSMLAVCIVWGVILAIAGTAAAVITFAGGFLI